MRQSLERYFQFSELKTNWRTEILAGLTTFVTMAYIIFVNPAILSETGMPRNAVTAATCLSAAVGSLLMGIYARYPIALAPGMGLNAYFTYAVVKGMGVPWQTALGAVFISGAIFLLLTAAGIRQLILEAIPQELFAAVAVGIGLFIAFIGFRNSGIVVNSPDTAVTLGNLRSPQTILAMAGLLIMGALMARGVRASILLGILGTTVLGSVLGVLTWSPHPYSPSELTGTLLQLDVRGVMEIGLLEVVFVFLFVDLFDNIGTLVAVGKRAKLFDDSGRIPRVTRILTCDATASLVGSLTGTSTVVSYIESAAGVVAGGRTGIPAIVCGLLFLLSLFIAPLAGSIPTAATAPALIIVGALMLSHAAEIDWQDPAHSIPAFLTLTAIPLTFSIANGLAFGFTSFTLIKLLSGRAREVNWLVWVLTALFLARFFYLGHAV